MPRPGFIGDDVENLLDKRAVPGAAESQRKGKASDRAVVIQAVQSLIGVVVEGWQADSLDCGCVTAELRDFLRESQLGNNLCSATFRVFESLWRNAGRKWLNDSSAATGEGTPSVTAPLASSVSTHAVLAAARDKKLRRLMHFLQLPVQFSILSSPPIPDALA